MTHAAPATSLPHPTRAVQAEALLASLRTRYAVKAFDPARKIPDGDWRALEQSLLLSPSSYGLQPWKFLVIDDPALRAKLLPVSWGQRQVVDASHFVVFAAKRTMDLEHVDRFLRRTAEVRGVSLDSLAAYRQLIMRTLLSPPAGFDAHSWSARQAYIALGMFMESAALLGIDTCPMEGIEPQKYDDILGLGASGYGAVVAAAAGYRSAQDAHQHLAKVRFDLGDVIEHR